MDTDQFKNQRLQKEKGHTRRMRAIYNCILKNKVRQLKPRESEVVAERMGALVDRIQEESIKDITVNDNKRLTLETIGMATWPEDKGYYDRAKLKRYLQRGKSRSKPPGGYVKSPQKQARLLETIISKTGWEKYSTYFDVFKETQCDPGSEGNTLGVSLSEEIREFINYFRRQVQFLTESDDIAQYFREVTRNGLCNYHGYLSNWFVGLKPSDFLEGEQWIIDYRGRATKGFILPNAEFQSSFLLPTILSGAVPSIPVCWLPIEGERFSGVSSQIVRLPNKNLKQEDLQEFYDIHSIDLLKGLCEERNSIELLKVAEIRIGLAPRNDRGFGSLIFEIVFRGLIQTEGGYYLTEYESPWIYSRALGLRELDFEALVGLPQSKDVGELFIANIDGASQEQVHLPMIKKHSKGYTLLKKLLGPNSTLEADHVAYLPFNESTIDILLVQTMDAVNGGLITAYDVQAPGGTIFPPTSPAEALQNALIKDEQHDGKSVFVRDLEERVDKHIAALADYQALCTRHF